MTAILLWPQCVNMNMSHACICDRLQCFPGSYWIPQPLRSFHQRYHSFDIKSSYWGMFPPLLTLAKGLYSPNRSFHQRYHIFDTKSSYWQMFPPLLTLASLYSPNRSFHQRYHIFDTKSSYWQMFPPLLTLAKGLYSPNRRMFCRNISPVKSRSREIWI